VYAYLYPYAYNNDCFTLLVEQSRDGAKHLYMQTNNKCVSKTHIW